VYEVRVERSGTVAERAKKSGECNEGERSGSSSGGSRFGDRGAERSGEQRSQEKVLKRSGYSPLR